MISSTFATAVLVFIIPVCLSQETPVYGPAFRERYEDAFLDPPQLIEKYGYPSEEYNVTTDDGYILVVHRIPYNESRGVPKKGTVILFHGLWETSSIWLLQGPSRALPYLLADEGYDVWLPNLRGNYYSTEHVTLSNKDTRFWEFTITEVGIYDVPAIMDHIKNTTGEEKYYCFGLAYGNTVLYVLLAEMPEYNDRVRLHVSLGPVASIANITAWYWRAGYFTISYLHPELALVGVNEVLPKTEANYKFSETSCQPNTPQQVVCMATLLWIVGYDIEQVNKTLLPVYAGHFPAGIGRNIFIQYGQSVRSSNRELKKFDYGPIKNQEKYGSTEPPGYDWGKITTPSIFYQGDRDTVTTAKDSKDLFDKLSNGIEYKIFHTYIHQDFVIGITSTKEVYEPILVVLTNY